jgi:4-amino-4-deoxy-L-arabinose transferase-like glycosyltransferase
LPRRGKAVAAAYDTLARVNQPTPAIVAQDAVRRLPRLALLLFCAAYVLPGFVGREPWKNADITAFGYMYELATGHTGWLAPTLLGQPPEFDALLPYWLGAWAIRLGAGWLPADVAARLPFAALLVLTLLATWCGIYNLARNSRAQPVPFAFGGEARPADYARAIADGGMLALIASLGLAQLSHETTPALAQLGFSALAFYGLAALPYRTAVPVLAIVAGIGGLALSGAPTTAVLLAIGGGAATLLDPSSDESPRGSNWLWAAGLLIAAGVVGLLASQLGLWRWRLWPEGQRDWHAAGKLLLWFTWPAGALAVWTVWRWRRQLSSRHVALPLWFAAVAIASTLLTPSSDRSLLLGLPALAALAAFALPTLKRSVAALIDWFTLLFFTGCAVVIWVVWISLQTGVPAKPAANVARLAPGFEPSFSVIAFVAALAGTLAWAWLVKWRAGRHRSALWKSLVLPAGGAALCWLLLMTLWLPVLDYARSYAPVVRGVTQAMDRPTCVQAFGLNRGQIAAFRFHGQLDVHSASADDACPWLVVASDYQAVVKVALDMRRWEPVVTVRRPTDAKDNVLLYRLRRAR